MSRPVHGAADRDHLAAHPRFPRASDYHPDWVFGNNMGPNALWLMEWLTEAVPLQPESRVLDMGCGRGITSVFLAEQFGVKVVANDLWIKPGDNWERFVEAGCADSIIPIHAEAHALPYADGYFDCLLSVDAYHYSGPRTCISTTTLPSSVPGGRSASSCRGSTRKSRRCPNGLPSSVTRKATPSGTGTSARSTVPTGGRGCGGRRRASPTCARTPWIREASSSSLPR